MVPETLSPRQVQVPQLLAEGRCTKGAAVLLGMRVKTAESHRHHIMVKRNNHDLAGFVRRSVRRGLIRT